MADHGESDDDYPSPDEEKSGALYFYWGVFILGILTALIMGKW